MKKLYWQVLALTVAMLGFATAQANTIDWATHDSAELVFSNPAPGSFNDFYLFSIASSSVLNTSVAVTNNNPPAYGIADGIYALWTNGVDGTFNGGAGDDVRLTPAGQWTFDSTTGNVQNSVVIDVGNYYFQVTGTATGNFGGVYTLTSAIAPVPEPEIYAMLGVGLGVIGWVGRRKKLEAVA